ncbi:MAG: transposase [Cytophagales bacterium]|nr:transposase [Cytophagales bacterium]
MSRKYKFGDNDKLYFISFSVVGWIDLFIRKEYKEIMLDSWQYCQKNKGLEIYCWCIMSSHIHMIIGSKERSLDKIVGEMKSFTSRSLRKAISEHPAESRREWMVHLMEKAGMQNSNNNEWQLWQQHNHPIELLNTTMFYQKMNYIHRNPVEAGFVENEEDYLYSSARDFFGKKGLVELSYVV